MAAHNDFGNIGVKMKRKPAPEFHDGQLGAAIAVRLKIGAKSTRIRKIDREGTVFIDLAVDEMKDTDLHLKNFLIRKLGVKPNQLEVLGSGQSNGRLVMIIDVDAEDIDQKIKKSLK